MSRKFTPCVDVLLVLAGVLVELIFKEPAALTAQVAGARDVVFGGTDRLGERSQLRHSLQQPRIHVAQMQSIPHSLASWLSKFPIARRIRHVQCQCPEAWYDI